MPSVHVIFRLLLAGSGLIFGVLSSLVFLSVSQNQEVSMASFQLHPRKVTWDFRILFAAMAAFGIAMAMYGVGGVTESRALLMGGRLLSFLFSFLPIFVFYRWWRRF